MVKFALFTAEEREAVKRIRWRFARGSHLSAVQKEAVIRNLPMDLSAVHAKNPLRLSELADAGDFDFFHDILGIAENINRETGELENCFSPRYSQ